MPDALAGLLAELDVQVRLDDVVLELGAGGLAPALAARAAHVVVLDPSRARLARARADHADLANVTWAIGDGETLDGVGDAAVDAALAPGLLRRVADARTALGYVAELGRVLKPGGWALFAVSTDDRRPETPAAASRRDLLRSLGRRAASGGAPAVPLAALGATAIEAGLLLERIEGSGTAQTVVLARREGVYEA
jgi:ubiquinone/menaquinone biosynthesis C-methylase UbiE